jgi:hypothetical protein
MRADESGAARDEDAFSHVPGGEQGKFQLGAKKNKPFAYARSLEEKETSIAENAGVMWSAAAAVAL